MYPEPQALDVPHHAAKRFALVAQAHGLTRPLAISPRTWWALLHGEGVLLTGPEVDALFNHVDGAFGEVMAALLDARFVA